MEPYDDRPRGWRAVLRWWPLVLLVVVCAGTMSIRTRVRDRHCRICASRFEHREWSVFGISVWNMDTKPVPTSRTRMYFYPYLGHAHEHEWGGGGYSVYGGGAIGCGSSPYGNLPVYQRRLTLIGFELVAASGIKDAEGRRRYFESIVKPTDAEHYIRALATEELILKQIETQQPRYRFDPWEAEMDGIEIPQVVREGGLVTADQVPR